MRLIKRESKSSWGKGYFYFGNYGEIPVGISYTEIESTEQVVQDKKHFHKESVEFYIVFKGKLLMEVGENTYEISQDQMLMVEPGEVHYIKAVVETPLSFIVFATVKKEGDKVLV